MKRLCLLIFVLGFGAGCSLDGPKQQWSDFKKEMNDDIILKSDFTQLRASDDASTPAKSRN